MDIILLPVLSRSTSPSDALAVMKESRRSVAAVVKNPPEGLINSLAVRKAKNQGANNLQNAEIEPLHVLFDGDFVSEGYGALKLPETSFAMVYEHLLQTFPGMGHRPLSVGPNDLIAFQQILPAGVAYGFLGYDRGAAVVMTQHEGLAAQAAGPPPDCCCANPQTPHEYPAGRKKTGQPCDNCAYLVEC